MLGVRAGTYAPPIPPGSVIDVLFKRSPYSEVNFGFDSAPVIEYGDKAAEFRILLPYWLIVPLYIVVWMGILAEPRPRRGLKDRHPPA